MAKGESLPYFSFLYHCHIAFVERTSSGWKRGQTGWSFRTVTNVSCQFSISRPRLPVPSTLSYLVQTSPSSDSNRSRLTHSGGGRGRNGSFPITPTPISSPRRYRSTNPNSTPTPTRSTTRRRNNHLPIPRSIKNLIRYPITLIGIYRIIPTTCFEPFTKRHGSSCK